MAVNKKRTGRVGRMTEVAGLRQSPPTPTVKRDPKLWKRVKDPAGFWKWEKRKPTSKVVPPSVRAKREQRAKQPPSVKYAGKPKAPKTQPDLKPLDKPPGRAKPKSQAAKRRALRTTGGRKLFGQRKTGTTAKWPSSKRMTYKGMSATTRHGSVPTSGFVVSHEQKKRPTKAKRGR